MVINGQQMFMMLELLVVFESRQNIRDIAWSRIVLRVESGANIPRIATLGEVKIR